MNYNVMCETDDYGLSNDTKYYANLFKAKTNINNANHYNDCQIIFRVFHISSTSGISMYKDYIFTTCRDKKDIVNLIDLSPNVKKIKIGYNISEEGEVVVLGKGSIIGAKLKIQVLYSPTIGMFEFFNCSSFTNNISCIEASKAEMTDIPDLTNYATKTYVTDEIAKAATSGKVDLTGYAKTADVNSALDTKAEKSTVEDISNSVTSIDTSLSGITERVSGLENDTATIINEINNLNIGGRNYIKNSIFANGLTHWEQNYSVSSIDKAFLFNNHATLKLSASGLTSDRWSGVMQHLNIDVAQGKTYTLSYYYYVQDLSTFDSALAIEVKAKKEGLSDVGIGIAYIPKNSIIEGKWTKISVTLTINITDISNPFVYVWLQRNGTAWFTNFKLEEGTIATDWTPAPEDVDESLSNKAEMTDIPDLTNYATKTYVTDEIAKASTITDNRYNEIVNYIFGGE